MALHCLVTSDMVMTLHCYTTTLHLTKYENKVHSHTHTNIVLDMAMLHRHTPPNMRTKHTLMYTAFDAMVFQYCTQLYVMMKYTCTLNK